MLFELGSVRDAYGCLFAAIIFEVIATSSMKANAGFSSFFFSMVQLVCYVLSFSLMTVALGKLPLGLAYTIWSGVGTTLVAIVGALHFNEKMPPMKAFAIFCVIASVVLLQIVSNDEEENENDANKIETRPLV